MKILRVFILLIFSSVCYGAVEYKKFDTPEQEEVYKVLIEEIRCLVCQNQTIADSNADLAKDLRRQVYEMLQQGKTKQQIADFMTQRYGDFVLYNPPFKAKTGLLWIGPIVFLLIGLVMLVLFTRKKKALDISDVSETDMKESAEKKAKVRALLTKGDQL
ncbi:MAG: cytochrome c-type biogenesis protein CcmH [Methylomarinum sp.]|nr:cytochrome c-type biogenesis protein CcmH [Methylomarinum sp.]